MQSINASRHARNAVSQLLTLYTVPVVYLLRAPSQPGDTASMTLEPTSDARGARLIWRGTL